MFPVDHDTYKTCTHEAVHALRALSSGHQVRSITIHVGESLITVGESLIQWSLFPWEVRTLLRTDTEYVIGLVRGVVGTCLAPSLQEHTLANVCDQAAYQPFKASWPRTAPMTWSELHKRASLETREWLAQPETRRQVRQMAERLFIYRGSLITGKLLAQIVERVTEQLAPPVAAPGSRQPAGAAQPAITAAQKALADFYAFYGLPATTAPAPERSTYAQNHRPNGRHQQHFLAA